MNQSEFECSLCKDKYRDPRLLPCLHSFCLECLETIAQKSSSSNCFTCPLCRASTQIPEGGVSSFEVDKTLDALLKKLLHGTEQWGCEICEMEEAVSYCLQCQQYFCSTCERSHKKAKSTRNDEFILISEMRNPAPQIILEDFCRIHVTKHLDLYCQTCDVLICSQCVPAHSCHEIFTMEQKDNELEKKINNLIQKANPRISELQQALETLKDTLKEIDTHHETANSELKFVFQTIRKVIDEREYQISQQLENVKQASKKEVSLQIDDLKFIYESIVGTCSFATKTLQELKNPELIYVKNKVVSRLTTVSSSDWNIFPKQDPMIEFSSNNLEILLERILSFGCVTTNEAFADLSRVIFHGLKLGSVNKAYTFGISAETRSGTKIEKGGDPFKIVIHGPSGTKGLIADHNNGLYTCSFTPKDVGEFEIRVLLRGKDIQDSPFRITVNRGRFLLVDRKDAILGKEGIEEGQFSSPFSLLAHPNGNIFVVDSNNHRVQVFDENRNFLFQFGSTQDYQLNFPKGISVDHHGNVVVVDTNNNRIRTFDKSGNLLMTFGSKGHGDGELDYPFAIAIDTQGNYLVTDTYNHRVQIFSPKGIFIKKIGSQGNGDGEFSYPLGIAIDSKENIYVSEWDNNRVQKFDSKWNFIRKFGGFGKVDGFMTNPWHLTIDENDHILVPDAMHRVQIFDEDGNFIKKFGVTLLNGPTCVVSDKNGSILVTEHLAHRISIF